MKFYAMVGHNPGTNRLGFQWPWPKVKVKRSTMLFASNPVQRRDKNYNVAYSILKIFLNMIMAVVWPCQRPVWGKVTTKLTRDVNKGGYGIISKNFNTISA